MRVNGAKQSQKSQNWSQKSQNWSHTGQNHYHQGFIVISLILALIFAFFAPQSLYIATQSSFNNTRVVKKHVKVIYN